MSSPEVIAGPSDTAAGGVADPPPPTTLRRSASATFEPFLVPILYLVVSLSIAWPVLSHLGRRVPGGADGVLFAWFFENTAQSVAHLHDPLLSSAMNAPNGLNLMWNGGVMLLAVICTPLTLTIGPFATVALLEVITPALSGAVTYAVLRKLTGRRLGPAIGGAIYAYGPFEIGQVVHLHVEFALFPPLLLLVGHRLLIEQKGSPRKVGMWLGVITGLQLLIAEEMVMLSAVTAAVALCWLVLLNRHEVARRLRYALEALLTGVLVALLIAGIPLAVQFFGANSLSKFRASPLRADIASLVRPSRNLYYASPADIRANLHYPANASENTAFLGWPLIIVVLVICAYFIIRLRDRFVAWWLLTTASVMVLMLGSPISFNAKSHGRGPWGLVRRLPLVAGVIPVRLSLLVLLLVAGFVAWVFSHLHGRAQVAAAAVAFLVLLPLRPVLPIDGQQIVATPRFFTTAAVQTIPEHAVTVVLPQAAFPRNQAMVWQIRTHLRFDLVGGYGVFSINGQQTYFPPVPYLVHALVNVGAGHALTPAAIDRARQSLATSRVQFVIITALQPNSDVVAAAASTITGCDVQQVEDVLVCRIPAGQHG